MPELPDDLLRPEVETDPATGETHPSEEDRTDDVAEREAAEALRSSERQRARGGPVPGGVGLTPPD